eukprot:gb/GFBE01037340.1/.p1 GENE.gb/GFBE01037340.1/~~gb/GFBE01037340.1/.p1  ORF type:complete len:134 (+),score=24.16 gb/GFBE01037340.1/:1-402(+)
MARPQATMASLDLSSCGLDQRRQALEESLWRSQEQDLEQRISLMERVLRQASGLDPVAAAAEQPRQGETFASSFQGPFVSRGQGLQEGIYMSTAGAQPGSAVAQRPSQSGTSQRPLSRFLAGDHDSVTKFFGM